MPGKDFLNQGNFWLVCYQVITFFDLPENPILKRTKLLGIVRLRHIGIGFEGFWAKDGTRLLRLVHLFAHPGKEWFGAGTRNTI